MVLVVAAEDGVMPQTREALAHSRAAGCPIVVAITKVDLPSVCPALQPCTLEHLYPQSYGMTL